MTRSFTPQSLSEAIAALAQGAVPVAGCTDLMVVDEATGRRHEKVADLLRVPELRGIVADSEYVDIGAACTFSEIRGHPLVANALPALARTAATIGGWQIQNRATIGGNIANASPAGDSLPVLLALDAELVLAGPRGTRALPYRDVHVGYRRTALEPGELICRIRIPHPLPGDVQLFRKVGTRAAQAISKVVVAFRANLAAGRLTRVRVAAGSIAPIPLRLLGTEGVCEGRPAGAATAEAAARAAAAEAAPIDDVRSTAAYRLFVLGRVVRRMVLDAAPDAGRR